MLLVLFLTQLILNPSTASAAACVVSSNADSGPNTLRDLVALGLAGGCDDNTITFDASLANQPIIVTSPIIIEADGPGSVNIISDVSAIVSGGTITQVFKIGFDETVVMEGFTISDGSFSGLFSLPNGDPILNDYRGGAIEMQDQVNLTLRDMTFNNNEAFVGGAIFNRGSSVLTISDTTFSNNRSRSNGGAISSNLGVIDIERALFQNNDSNASGGAIQHFSDQNQTITIKNSTFTENAGKQGIIFIDESTANISHVTMVNNQVRAGVLYADFGGTVNVQNSIIWDITLDPDSGNLATGGACVNGSMGAGGTTNATNNIVPADNTECQATAFSTADPQLAALADNGGATHTMMPAEASLAVNNADITFCPADDQRGTSRPQPTGGSCDIGAVEFTIDPPLVSFSTNLYNATEGDGSVAIGITLSKAVNYDVTASVQVTNREDLNADAASEQTIDVTFAAGETAQTVVVLIPDDLLYEGTRAVDLEITSVVDGVAGSDSTAVLNVADNDSAPIITIQGATVEEGSTASFIVNLDQAAAVDVTVDYELVADKADLGDDIQANNGTLTIPAGQTSGTIDIVIVDDAEAEGTENFFVTLSNLNNAEAGDAGLTAEGTISPSDGGSDLFLIYTPFVVTE